MVRKFRCELCGGGEFAVLRKEIYEQNGGSYHNSISFKGNRRVFKCTECGKMWWSDPISEFMNLLSPEVIRNNVKISTSALKTG
ncbi:MAG TPA: hypothetical protein PKG52_08435 [bacterium]|nr:hypothetical protein [bacterium]HPS30555.1 hypothetical protein [bacterium]